MGSSYESVTVDIADHVAQVTLIGPGKGNAMGPAFWAELPVVFAELDADPDVRAIVLTGSGRNFSYGLDLAAMGDTLGSMMADSASAKPRAEFHARLKTMQDAITAVADCRTPTIASVHGWCIGGGVDLISAVDIRYASADAKFSVREVKLAIVADVGSLARLPLILSDGHLRELALTGKDIDAARAEKIGLVNDVYPDAEASLAAAHATAAEIAANPPHDGARHQGRPRRAAHRRGVGQPALRRGVELGVPAVQGPHRGHQSDVREAGTELHRRVGAGTRLRPAVSGSAATQTRLANARPPIIAAMAHPP